MTMTGAVRSSDAATGIITALPKEFAAVLGVFDCQKTVGFPTRSGCVGRSYSIAQVPADDGGHHTVVAACLTKMGTTSAAARASMMLNHWPNMHHILMVGIAGGIPAPDKAEDHVRLGDIVVSSTGGVVQYDMIKESVYHVEMRPSSNTPAPGMLDAHHLLQSRGMLDERPWECHIDSFLAKRSRRWARPAADSDKLIEWDYSTLWRRCRVRLLRLCGCKRPPCIPHPVDDLRGDGRPRVFTGPIASADTLLKNPRRRNMLRRKFGAKAVEMEGIGIANATWEHESGYLVVRGICDYCNDAKNDLWQDYAALVAAAYARALIEKLPSSWIQPGVGMPDGPRAVGEIAERAGIAPSIGSLLASSSGQQTAQIPTSAAPQPPVAGTGKREYGPIDTPSAAADPELVRIKDILASMSRARENENTEDVLLGAAELEKILVERESALPRELERVVYKELAKTELTKYELAQRSGGEHGLDRFRAFAERASDAE